MPLGRLSTTKPLHGASSVMAEVLTFVTMPVICIGAALVDTASDTAIVARMGRLRIIRQPSSLGTSAHGALNDMPCRALMLASTAVTESRDD